MATLFIRPPRPSHLIRASQILESRCLFSTSRACTARNNQFAMPTMKQKPQKSLQVTMEEAQKKLEIPDDNGILPGMTLALGDREERRR